MKKWIATLLNFFLPGAGYLVLGHKVPLAVMWPIGAVALTYVEQIHTFPDGQALQAHDGADFGALFVAASALNTAAEA